MRRAAASVAAALVVAGRRCSRRGARDVIGVGHPRHHHPRRFLASSTGGGAPAVVADDAEAERHRARYQEAMRTLGAPPSAIPPMAMGGRQAAAASAASAAAAPPLSPQQVLAAAKLPSGEAICKDPSLGQSLPALLFLADIFWTGLVVEKQALPPSPAAAAAEGGEEDAGGLIVAQDHAKAARLWAEAAGERFGDQGAKYNYAQCLLRGHGVPENPQQAEHLLTQLAEGEQGDPRACYSLAVLLASRLQQQHPQPGQGQQPQRQQEQGEEGQRAAERVYALLVRAVKGGVLPAVHNLANVLAQGHGPRLPRDDAAAFALYEQGAALGDPWSTFTLGSWLCQGRGGEEEDWERGFALHLRAAERFGMPQAAFNVGTHYFAGRGVEQDMGKAAAFFGRAAEAGMTQAMINLGNMHLEGLIVVARPSPSASASEAPGSVLSGLEAARVWYRRAADMGDPAGRECLAKCDALEREEREERERAGKKEKEKRGGE